jgi:Cu/Zn superoxide dismutase
MKRAIACTLAAAAAVAGAVAGSQAGAGASPTGLVSLNKTPVPAVAIGSAKPSPSPSGDGQSAASDGGSLQGTTGGGSLSSSYVQAGSYRFRTLDDGADPTFNQLLGVNDDGVVAGYFGSGAPGHPNMGFRVSGANGSFVDENVPGSAQTQVTGLNNHGVSVGFYAPSNNAGMVNANSGFYDANGSFHKVVFPAGNNADPQVDQLLGVNDSNVAVGFYTDAAGNNHAYEYNIGRHSFRSVKVYGATSATAAAINDGGDVAGFFTTSGGTTEGFLLTASGKQVDLAYPGASMTQALGVNSHDEVVGFYQVGTGDNAATHGFTWTHRGGFKKVDDGYGVGATTVNGVNDSGVLAGFYTDSAGNTHGMLATPSHGGTGNTTQHLTLAAMPAGKVTLDRDEYGRLQATVSATGLTPGSAHTVEIDAPGYYQPVVTFTSPLTADGTGAVHATLQAASYVNKLPYGSRFVIRLGQSDDSWSSWLSSDPNAALAAEPIARTGQLSSKPWGYASTLNAVDVDTNGDNLGQLTGRATVVYNPNAKTLTVTLTASGLTPGAHAAHIHTGSCQAQGGVLYMLMDFQADAYGNVAGETRTVTGVTSPLTSGTWYLNLHQGDSNTILANGAPALPFRPLLCANG